MKPCYFSRHGIAGPVDKHIILRNFFIFLQEEGKKITCLLEECTLSAGKCCQTQPIPVPAYLALTNSA